MPSDEIPGRDILDGLPVNAALIDSDGEIIDANTAWREFGHFEGLESTSETIGVNYLEVCQQAVGDPYADAARDGIEAVLDGRRESFQLEYPCHSPVKKRWFRLHVGRIDQPDGPFAVLAHTNITEMKTARIRLEQRVTKLEDLVQVISHDLRNPLNVAEGYLTILTEEIDHEAIAKIDTALARGESIVEDTLALLRADTTEFVTETVDLGDVVRDAWKTVETGDATLIVDESTPLEAQPGLLHHLFENLLRNAIEHGRSDVTITVGTLPNGFFLEDDGPGIDPSIRDELFDIGTTTQGDGTGFGLAIVRQCVDRHGWDISLAEASDGARFEIQTKPRLEKEERPEVLAPNEP